MLIKIAHECNGDLDVLKLWQRSEDVAGGLPLALIVGKFPEIGGQTRR